MWDYGTLKELLRDEPLPAMVVDLDCLDANTARIRDTVQAAGKTLRLATKSVRVPALIRRILDRGGPAFRGLMCYSAQEALLLRKLGFDDFLVAYPTVAREDFAAVDEILESGGKIALMVDGPEQLAALEVHRARRGGPGKVPVLVDADVSFRVWGPHLGVRRSPVLTVEDFAVLAKRIQDSPAARFAGVMAYEAQVAGVGDESPFAGWKNFFVRLMKRFSVPDVARRRAAITERAKSMGLAMEIFNGGGTGSLKLALQEPWLTEVTAGSGFLQSHLFDYYAGNRNVPALAFALSVTRLPAPGFVTCQSGGFIASGEAGPSKQPIPFLPPGLSVLSGEGFGEVQTPFRVPAGTRLLPGDPVLCRPAKAGEIAEHFSHYVLVEKGRIVERVPTYRGLGHRF